MIKKFTIQNERFLKKCEASEERGESADLSHSDAFSSNQMTASLLPDHHCDLKQRVLCLFQSSL